VLADQRGAPLTYDTLDGLPRTTWDGVLGTGDAAFAAGTRGLREWQAHRGAGLVVVPDDAPLEVGTEVAVGAPFGPVHAVAVCRVVRVIDEPDRFGFAYGTMPVHPETGEEEFVVERAADGTVRFHVEARSRPRGLARLAGPLATLLQRRAGQAYIDALTRFVSG
jgi:uncharacterized protein (UPF0548 family)